MQTYGMMLHWEVTFETSILTLYRQQKILWQAKHDGFPSTLFSWCKAIENIITQRQQGNKI